MKFKYGDVVEIEHEFYGKVKGIVKRHEHDSIVCGMNPKTGESIHNEQCYSYCIDLCLQDEVIQLIDVYEKELKLIELKEKN